MGFTPVLSPKFDESKSSLIFGSMAYRLNDENIYAMRYLLNTAQILSKDFNIFVFSISNNQKSCKKIMEKYSDFNYVFYNSNDFTFLRKAEDKDAYKKDLEMILDALKIDLPMVKNIKGLFIQPTILITSKPNNELFDCISKDPEKLAIANKDIEDMNKGISKKQIYPFTMFMTKDIRVMMDTFIHYKETYNCPIYQFCIYPGHYTKYFDMLYGAKTYYLEDDFRGNRELHAFPMGPLNYFFNNEQENVPNFEDKDNIFMWGGIVIFPKGARMSDYLRFLDKFDYKNSVLHLANGGHIKKSKKPRYSSIMKAHPLFEQAKQSVETHPLNQGIIPNELFEEKLKDYKYTLIMRCISDNDSLNFRIFYSLLYNMIPLITDDYDPDYLQIPKVFYDQLRVNNSIDIKNKIDYFENNMEETKKLLNELKEYYFKPEYLQENYYYKLFKENYFKELY